MKILLIISTLFLEKSRNKFYTNIKPFVKLKVRANDVRINTIRKWRDHGRN